MRQNVSFPENDHSGPPVEMRFNLGGTRYAIEHTLLEPFPHEIETGLAFQEFVSEIEAQLDGKMPKPGIYNLLFPIDPASSRHRRTHAKLRTDIKIWVGDCAQQLHAECPERLSREILPSAYFGRRDGQVDGLTLTLSRRVHWSDSGEDDGRLRYARVVNDDLENQRLVRIRTALDRKLPKLADCGAEGDTTVLILEYSDIALSNHVLIAKVLESLWDDRTDWPDHIIIADTSVDRQWYYFRPVIEGSFSFDREIIKIRLAAETACALDLTPPCAARP